MTVAEQIIKHRKRCGLTQTQLATAIGLSRSAISKIEGGERNPSTELLQKIGEVFGCSVEIKLIPIK